MASKPTLYDWGDGNGKIHTISKAEHEANVRGKKAPGAIVTGPYDPNLDFALGTETRQYESNIDDLNLGDLRGGIDLGTATERYGALKGRNQADYDTGVADIERSAGRSLTDLISARTRSTEDYGSTLANLEREYGRLGDAQSQTARKMGVEASGGANIQSARKRAENQAHDKAPIDLAYQRYMADSTRDEGRLGEDRTSSLGKLLTGYERGNQDLDWGQADTVQGYQRASDDRDTQRLRFGTEHRAFGLDTNTAKQLQGGLPAVNSAGMPVAPLIAKKKKPRVVTYSNAGQVTTP